ncbi:MAG: NAD-dependent epimerase/dehydratase family protein [Planctomycetota bacterium]
MERALVTGGGGFLGGAIVDALLGRGANVASLSRGSYPALDAKGVQQTRADLGDGPDAIARALEDAGADTVFHCAALPGVYGPAAAYERANVAGTQNVLDACLRTGVKTLVFTSSPSVVFDGGDHRNAGPDLPYPARYLAHYPRTKAEAERAALRAHSRDLRVVSLRPHLIFGPGDPNLVPRLLDRADAGRLARVGSRDTEVSLTYVENAAEAHVVAAECLRSGGGPADALGGSAFFVNQTQPARLWDWIDRVLVGTGRAPLTKRVPPGVAYAAGALLEGAWRALRRTGEPPMTRFVAKQLSRSHTYSMEPFLRATGGRYAEAVGLDEATERTIAAFTVRA